MQITTEHQSAPAPREKRRRLTINKGSALKAVLFPAALLVGAGMVMSGSTAAFTSSTKVAGNSAKAATIAMSNDKSTQLFDLSGLRPGASETRCVTVTNKSDVPLETRMYGENITFDKGMNSHLSLTVIDATAASWVDNGTNCGGAAPGQELFTRTLGDFQTYNNGWSGGLASNVLAPGQSKMYGIKLAFSPDAPDSAQGGTGRVSFVWEGR